ncbi:MAG: TRAP transporter TatT component family protein [Acidobacteriota bacterium]
MRIDGSGWLYLLNQMWYLNLMSASAGVCDFWIGRRTAVSVTILLLFSICGCSVRRFAVNRLGDALAQSGTSIASDNDPDLIKDAAPFSLKLIESLLAEVPRHRALLTAAASNFTQYTYAFVQLRADELEDQDIQAATALRLRARRLYLRARDFGLRGLEVKHPDFARQLKQNARQAVQAARVKDVPLLYWTASAWALAISVSKDQPEIVADQPIVEALIDRALELDEDFESGAIHGFLISYEMSRPGGSGDPAERARRHFERALQLSGEMQASFFVSFAESVSVTRQDRAEFEQLLNRALAIDVERQPEWRLANLIMQRRARWLLGRIDELFL